MKKMSKLLSVIVALMVCVGMVAPALALEIDQNYINGLEVKTHETYGTKYVEVKGVDENDTTFNMKEDIKTEYTLYFGNQDNVTLNMNGHTLDHQDKAGSVIMAENTNLTINGGDEENMGKITGGNAYEKNQLPGAQEADNGGGIHVNGGSLTVTNTEISGNTATHNGSAVFAKDTDKVTMNNVVVEGNTATGETGSGGGTISITRTKEVDLEDVTIRDNESSGVGGGLAVQDSGKVDMNNVEITGNESTGEGTYVPLPYGGGMYASNVDEINMNKVTISGNTANTESGTGGGMYAYNVGKIDMNDATISNNEAYYGGGVYAHNVGSIEMNNTQITGNTAGGAYGGGMYIYSDSTSTTVNGTNTVIADNTFYGGDFANDVFAYANGETIDMKFGPTTYGDKVFDGWSDSMKVSEFVREGDEADADGAFGNNYSGNWGWMTFHWTEKPDEGDKTPVPPMPPEPPVVPDPDPVEIEDPDTPLGEEPDDPVDIEEPEVPLGELPEIEIDEPDVPLGDVPQTGDISFMWYGVIVVSIAGLLGLSLLERKKRQED
ncbi:MAG: hypothetical protein HDT33_02700 [Clostridiales bacterium]|nr:hypothetical protein [Clostridiales bacterium]